MNQAEDNLIDISLLCLFLLVYVFVKRVECSSSSPFCFVDAQGPGVQRPRCRRILQRGSVVASCFGNWIKFFFIRCVCRLGISLFWFFGWLIEAFGQLPLIEPLVFSTMCPLVPSFCTNFIHEQIGASAVPPTSTQLVATCSSMSESTCRKFAPKTPAINNQASN